MPNIRFEWVTIDEQGFINSVLNVEESEVTSHKIFRLPSEAIERRHSYKNAIRIASTDAEVYFNTLPIGSPDITSSNSLQFTPTSDAIIMVVDFGDSVYVTV